MKYKKRLFISIATGFILGIFCIIGIGFRIGFAGNELFLLSAWFNRIIMGFVIGLSGYISITKKFNVLVRGAIIGLIISFSWFLDTGFKDFMGFFAGIVYGIIIDIIATKNEKIINLKKRR